VTGWMLELGYFPHSSATNNGFECGYRIYITGDTLLCNELKEMYARYEGKKIDLMMMHLGGAILPEPNPPSLTSMDASQGLQLLQLIRPDLTIPIHYDDYDIFKSPLKEFRNAVKKAGLEAKVLYLKRREEYRFKVR
jgi:L-ascorbate metabolism protein UlaG (beta-lactamase superfamily)